MKGWGIHEPPADHGGFAGVGTGVFRYTRVISHIRVVVSRRETISIEERDRKIALRSRQRCCCCHDTALYMSYGHRRCFQQWPRGSVD